MRKAQSSIETLAIGGAAICIIAIMFFFMAKSNPQPVIDTKNSLLTLDDLSKAAERIYQQGVGSKTQILVSLPNDAKMVSFSQRKIIITYNSGKTQQRSVDFEVYGTINSTKGMQKIPVESFEKGVCFGDINTCAQCGNNIIEGSEQCEGLNLNGLTCRDFGYDRGNLGCSACNYNMSACVPAVCGNNLKEVGEECDGFDLANETCYTQGWWSGPLSCQNCIINDSSCKIAQSVCLGIDINEITLDAADNRIHGFEATNLCNFTIYIRGANVSWKLSSLTEAQNGLSIATGDARHLAGSQAELRFILADQIH